MLVGFANGGAPGVSAVSVDVFLLGVGHILDEGLGQVGESGGGFGFDVACSDGAEEASEGGVEVAGGDEGAGEVIGDVDGGLLASEGLRFLAGVKGAEVRMILVTRHAAMAAVREGEGTRRDRISEAIRHGYSPEKKFGI